MNFFRKKMIFPIILLLSGSFAAAEPSFELSFDNGVAAEFAVGEREPYAMSSSIGVSIPGIMNGAARIGHWNDMMIPGTTSRQDMVYRYHYHADGNLFSDKGAVSFWVAPEDWDGYNGAEEKGFFTVSSADGSSGFIIYKVAPDAKLFLWLFESGKTMGSSICSVAGWKQGEWHHIVCSYDNGTMIFYVDGKAVHTVNYPVFTKDFANFALGSIGYANEKGASRMDEVKLFAHPLTQEEVTALFRSGGGKGAEYIVNLGRSGKAPVVDGVVGEWEYDFGGTGLLNLAGDRLFALQGRYYAAHDGSNLYFAMTTPLPADAKVLDGRPHDGSVWEDESIELHLLAGGRAYQFVVNPDSGIYDACDKNSAWNSAGFHTKSTVSEGVWSWEAAVPLAELGITDGRFSMNLARSFKSPFAYTCAAKVTSSEGYAYSLNFLQMNLLDTPAVPFAVESMEFGKDGQFSVRAGAAERDGVNCLVQYFADGREIFEDEQELVPEGNIFSASDLPPNIEAVITVTDADNTVRCQNTYTLNKITPNAFSLQYIYTDMANDIVKFVCSSLLPPAERGTLEVAWFDQQEEFLEKAVYSLDSPELSFEISYPADHFAPGYYTAKGTWTSVDGSETRLVFQEMWFKPENKEITDYTDFSHIKRQKPWEAVRQEGSSVFAGGKEYVFSDGVLLAQAVTDGENLLSNSMFLSVNGSAEVSGCAPQFENHGDYCLVYQLAEYGDVTVETCSRVDYDGMIKVWMTFIPPEGGCRVDSMQLVVPFDDSRMTMIHGNDALFGHSSGRNGLLNDEEWRENLFQKFAFWIGNVDHGFSWIAKNMKNWHCYDTASSLVVRKEGDSRLAIFNFADCGFDLIEPRTIEFAVMATPARPYSPETVRTQLNDIQMWSSQSTAFFDYPEDDFWVAPFVSGPGTFYYFSFAASPHSPHWNYYHKQWHSGSMGMFAEDLPVASLAARNKEHYIIGCFDSPTFLDFKVKHLLNVIGNDSFNVQNLYFDLLSWSGCASEDHGCCWSDDFGRKWKSLDWEGRRTYLQIARRELLKRNPKGLVSLHNHYQRIPMLLAYGDIQVGGEDFLAEVGNTGNYYDVVNRDMLICHSSAYGFGPKSVFIPQFERSLLFIKPGTSFDFDDPVNIHAMRHLLVMLFALDIDPWYVDHKEAEMIWQFQDDFGWDKDTLFVPDWRSEGLFTVTDDSTGGKLLVSLFRREGRFILLAVNDSAVICNGKITLDLESLLGKSAVSKITSLYEEEELNISGNILSLTLVPRGTAVLSFE